MRSSETAGFGRVGFRHIDRLLMFLCFAVSPYADVPSECGFALTVCGYGAFRIFRSSETPYHAIFYLSVCHESAQSSSGIAHSPLSFAFHADA